MAYLSHHAVIIIVIGVDRGGGGTSPPRALMLRQLANMAAPTYHPYGGPHCAQCSTLCGKCLNCGFLLMRVVSTLISALVCVLPSLHGDRQGSRIRESDFQLFSAKMSLSWPHAQQTQKSKPPRNFAFYVCLTRILKMFCLLLCILYTSFRHKR